jgi:threonine synthase
VFAVDQLGLDVTTGVPVLAMETAKPFKFNETMKDVLGVTPPRPERFRGLEERMAGVALTHIADAPGLLTYLRSHTKAKAKYLI